MPAPTERARRFFGAVVGGAAPLPSGMSMSQARDFARKPDRFAEGGVAGTAPPMPRYAEGGQTGGDERMRIYQRMRQNAIAQGASPQEADAFARSMVAVSGRETGGKYDAASSGDNGASRGLFHLHERGEGAGMGNRRLDPDINIDTAFRYLYPTFVQAGGAAAWQRDPVGALVHLFTYGQKADRGAIAQAASSGDFLRHAQVGNSVAQQGGATASAGSPSTPPAPAPAPRPRAPVDGPITQGYGPTNVKLDGPYQGHANFNKGIDYGVPPGTPVKSMTGGRVLEVQSNANAPDGWGIAVRVDAGDGTIHNYGHLSAANVKAGDQVTPGQVLAASGNTGKSTGPHLSYDIWRAKPDGSKEYIDPNTYTPSAASTTTASASGTPAGAAAPRGGAATTTQTATSPEQTRAAARQKAYDDAVAEYNALSRQPRSPENDNRLLALESILPVLQRDADDAQKDAIASARLNPQGLSPDQAAASELGWAQLAETRRSNDREIVSTLLANDQVAQRLALDIIEHNDLNQERQVASAIRKGEVASADARAILEARHNQQVDQLMWAAEGMKRAQWIDEVNFRNAERILPPGTRYQRGFEDPAYGPPSSLNAALALWGIPPIIVETTQVPRESLDPMANLARGRESLEQAGIGKPNYGPDIQRLETQYADNRNLPTFQAPKGGAQLPAGTEAGDWQTQLSALLSGNQPQTQPLSGAYPGGEPEPLPTPPNLVGGEEAPRQNVETGGGATPGGTRPVQGVPGPDQPEGGTVGIGRLPVTPPNRVGGEEAPRQNPEVGQGGPAPGPRPSPVQRQPATTPPPVMGPQRGPQPGPLPTPVGPVTRAGYYDSSTGEYVYANGSRIKIA